jgi:hypothetical protein
MQNGCSPRNTFTAFLLCFAATQARSLLLASIVRVRAAHSAGRITACIIIVWHIGDNATSVL